MQLDEIKCQSRGLITLITGELPIRIRGRALYLLKEGSMTDRICVDVFGGPQAVDCDNEFWVIEIVRTLGALRSFDEANPLDHQT